MLKLTSVINSEGSRTVVNIAWKKSLAATVRVFAVSLNVTCVSRASERHGHSAAGSA